MNYISMIFYFLASALLIAFAATNNNFFLIGGIVCLAIAVIFGQISKKRRQSR